MIFLTIFLLATLFSVARALSASAQKVGIFFHSVQSPFDLSRVVFLQVFIQSSISTDSPYCALLDFLVKVNQNCNVQTLTGILLQWQTGKALRIPKILRSYSLRGKLNGQPIENISGLIGWFQSNTNKKTIETMYAECKLCSDGIFYTGNVGSFSNFSRYVARKREKEYEIFVKSNKSDPKQPSMSNFTIPSVIGKR